MTSSLVGSEMCIRDRQPHPRPCAALPAWVPLVVPLWPICARPAGGTPVSYTHLTLPTICSV
eukprot:526659-Prorocentrum_lima.AAC.1